MSRKDIVILFLICLGGLALRALLLNIGLTIDDACSAAVVESDNLDEMIKRIKEYEMSPLLYFLVLQNTTKILGLSCITMALPSFIFGVLTIPSTFLLARQLALQVAKDPQTTKSKANQVGLLAAYFQAFSTLAIIYSHEARTYALAGFLLTWVLIFYWQFFENLSLSSGLKRMKAILGLYLSATALLLTHYTGIFYMLFLALLAVVFRNYKKDNGVRPLASLIPIILSFVILLPWLPILLYHKQVGTPWADPTPLVHFPHVFAGNLAAMLALPVVPGYLLVITLFPLLLFIYLLKGHKDSALKTALINGLKNPLLLSLLSIIAFSCAIFGYITPYMFGYVRYLSPIVPLTSALLAYIIYRPWAETRLWQKAIFIAFLLFSLGGATWEVQRMTSQDRSGLRQLARDILSGKFNQNNEQPVYWTAPDFVGMILTFYLKHDAIREPAGSSTALPSITGFACPESGTRPVKHEEDRQWWQNKNVLDVHRKLLAEKMAQGATTLVLVRDTYKPNSKLMPTKDVTDSFINELDSRYTLRETKHYAGNASSYDVSVYDLRAVSQ